MQDGAGQGCQDCLALVYTHKFMWWACASWIGDHEDLPIGLCFLQLFNDYLMIVDCPTMTHKATICHFTTEFLAALGYAHGIGSRGSFTAHQGYWICHHICTWSSVKLAIFKIVLCNWGGAPSHSLISYWNSLFSSHWLWGSFISIYFQYAILLGFRWTRASCHMLTFFSPPHHCAASHSLSTWSADGYMQEVMVKINCEWKDNLKPEQL